MKTQRGNRICLFAGAAILLAFLSSPIAFGQVFGRISGTAKDPTGSVVPAVSVTAICTETGIKSTSQTDVQGFYAFPSLPVGHYDVQASAAGFKDFSVTGLTLDVNSALLVDIPLSLGSQAEHISVEAAALQVETTSTQMGEVISGNSITSIPLNGRSYLGLLALQPGVAPYSSTYNGGNGGYFIMLAEGAVRTPPRRCSPRPSSTARPASTRGSASRRTSLRAMLRRRIPIEPSTGRISSPSPVRRASGTKTILPIRRHGTSPCSASSETTPLPAFPMWAR